MAGNKNIQRAKAAKNDEFYTQFSDIEKELVHYKEHLKNKIIYCNCDNPSFSNFWKYFYINFSSLQLKKLVATYYDIENTSYVTTYDGERITRAPLIGNGDFRSRECVEILAAADVVVTNPPFSLVREYIAQLTTYKKKFLIIGNINAVTYKEIFPLIKANKIWTGVNAKEGSRKGNSLSFEVPDDYDRRTTIEDGKRVTQVSAWWFTNINHKKHHETLKLTKSYSPDKYPKYDNYDAINVNRTSDIPKDYEGAMGVPVSWLDKYCPEQFKIIYALNSPIINGNGIYKRIIVRNLHL